MVANTARPGILAYQFPAASSSIVVTRIFVSRHDITVLSVCLCSQVPWHTFQICGHPIRHLKRPEWSAPNGLRLQGGYNAEHATKLQTLRYSLADSPVSLLAWIYENWTLERILTPETMKVIFYRTILTQISTH
ncbi:hypothetical protein FB451DRAFT_1024124 [Mycena latifolia]|nr:hypothetical protein FB451DRAFT_1024124 [Mycena latifolia]